MHKFIHFNFHLNKNKILFGTAIAISVCTLSAFYYAARNTPKSLTTLRANCLQKQGDYQKLLCLEPYFEQITLQTSAIKANEEAVALKNQGVSGTCHVVSHYIGKANLKKNKGDIKVAFETCPPTCQDGCYHGAIEQYVTEKLTHQNQLEINTICEDFKKHSIARSRSCFHGLGHGLVKLSSSEMDAYNYCLTYTKTSFDKIGCVGGVAMEKVNPYLSLSKKELHKAMPKICENERKSDKPFLYEVCIGRLVGDIAYYTNNNEAEGKTYCLDLRTTEQEECSRGLKREIRINIEEDTDPNASHEKHK